MGDTADRSSCPTQVRANIRLCRYDIRTSMLIPCPTFHGGVPACAAYIATARSAGRGAVQPESLMPSFHVHVGTPLPLGAQSRNGGVNFALFSRHATALELLLYDAPEAPQHCAFLPLDPARRRTGDIWHIYLEDIGPGQVYAWRAHGPYRPEAGLRYNRHKLLLAPYARALCNTRQCDYGAARGYDAAVAEGDLSLDERDNEVSAARCLVMADDFDWHGDRPLRLGWEATVLS